MDQQDLSTFEDSEVAALDFIMPLPLTQQVTDIYQLAGGRSDIAVAFLEDIMSGKLAMELPSNFRTGKWLFDSYIESRNRNRLLGGHWFWFGFPLIQISDYQQNILAPLWLWPLRLQLPPDQDTGWTIQLLEDPAPQPNPEMDALFREKLNWESEWPWWQTFQEKSLNIHELSRQTGELIQQLGIESPSQSVSISPWSDADLSPSKKLSSKLIWSGLLGNFPPGGPANTASQREEGLEPSLVLKKHPFGLLARDPWQESAFQEARQKKGVLINGRAGSGKTALLKDMLINALSNGERCLVVSNRLPVLRELQSDLLQADLEKFTLFFQNDAAENKLVLNLLKAAANVKKDTSFQANRYAQELANLLEEKKELDKAYQAVNKRVLGPYTWTQTVGLYLSASRLESKALLASQLQAQDFEMGFERYQSLAEQLSHSQSLFEDIKTLSHPLTKLNAGIFVHQEKEEARSFILSRIKSFREQAFELQYRFILEQNDYGDRLVESYEQYYRQFMDESVGLSEKIQSYRNQFGRDPLESTRTTLKLYASFSDKFRKTLQAKNDIAENYSQLEKAVKLQSFFQHEFLPLGERHLLNKLLANLDSLQQALYAWREQLGNLVQEELIRLSSKTVHPDLHRHETVAGLENELDLLLDNLNDSGLLQLPLENKNLTLPKRQRFLEELVEKLEALRLNMRDFDRFFDWQRYWFSLPAETRRIITALVKVRPNDWAAAFSSWYLHHLLLQSASPDLPESSSDLKSFAGGLQKWRKQLPDQIFDYWMDQRSRVLQKVKKERKKVYDWLTSKKQQEQTLEMEVFTNILSHFFPIHLATPYSLPSYLNSAKKYDCLLLEEGHLISPKILDDLTKRAGRTIVFSNPDSDNTKLLKWIRQQRWSQRQLEGKFQSIALSIRMEEVGGRYNSRQHINDEEIRRLLVLLNEIEPKPGRTLPKVAIVCLRRSQRNLLIQYLDRIKKQGLAGVEKIKQLERNGLGVYTPDELFGMHVDVLFVSCTFGPAGAGDQLTKNIQDLNRWIKAGLVPLLCSRARESMFILHSFPEEDLRRMAKETKADNSNALARWLLQLKAKQEHTNGQHSLEEYPIHPLAQEVAWHIADQVRTDRLAFNTPFQNYILPLTLTPAKEEPPKAILFNGFLAETPACSYEWEGSMQEALRQQHFIILPIWAASWWRRPKEEAARLSVQLNGAGEEEE